MPGENGIREKAVVIGPEGVAAGVRVLQRYGNVAIVEAGPEDDPSPGADAPATDAAGAEDDSVEALALAAFRLRQSAEYIAAAKQFPYDGMEWNAIPDPLLRPDPPPEILQRMELEAQAFDAANPGVRGTTSQRMTGNIRVSVVLVSGPGPQKLTQSDKTNIMAGVQASTSWLAQQSPAANITWHIRTENVSLDVTPNPTTPPAEQEAVWLNPTMQALGYEPQRASVLAYAKSLQQGVDWAYVAFITKYPVDHPAYAYRGGPFMVMAYPTSLKPEQVPQYVKRIFAHESGHIFQAPDEYPPCDCDEAAGFYGVPNGNCQECAGDGVKCVMRHNSLDLCSYTPWHFGVPWPTGTTSTIATTAYASPSAAVFGDALTVLFLSSGGGAEKPVEVTSSSDGVTWTTPTSIPGSDATVPSLSAPTACVFNGNLYAFWRAGYGVIHYSFWNGQSWSPVKPINQADSTWQPLGACVFNGSLYLFWIAADNSNSIYYSALQEGGTWPNGQKINNVDATSTTPVPCVFNGQLYLFWVSNNPWGMISYSVLQSNGTWPNGTPINDIEGNQRAPSPLVYGSRLLLFWQGSGNIYTTALKSDGTWLKPTSIVAGASVGSAVASVVFNGSPYLFWTTDTPENGIVYSR